MNRRKLITVAALAVVAFACSETVGGVMQDAGDMLADAGDMMQPDAGAQDEPASCNKSEPIPGTEDVRRWAEFPISSPGQTEVTTCYRAEPEGSTYRKRAWCQRIVSPWHEGTSTGFLYTCGDNVTSITVHN